MNKKRIFVSIDLEREGKEALKSIVRRDVYWIKWMSPENFHITLNFLGDLGSAEIEEAKKLLSEVAETYQPFALKLKNFRGEEDMLWLMPEKNETLEKLQWQLRMAFKDAGIGKRERRAFAAHILVAKSKTGRHMSWRPDNFREIKFDVNKVNLYESELTPGAATHRLIQSFLLSSPSPTSEREG